MWPEQIATHRDAEVCAQLLEETIRESRQQGDDKETLLDKVKRAVSQIQANLSTDSID